MKRTISFLLCLSFSVLSLQSQTSGNSGKKIFTLDECLKTAGSHNYDIQNAQAKILSATSDVSAAFGTYLPSVTYTAGYGRAITPQSDFPNSYSMGLNANLNIFDGFNKESNYTRAQKTLSAVDVTAQQTQRSVFSTIRTQYLLILRNSQVVNTRREDLQISQKELEHQKALNEAGSTPIANVYAQEADMGNKELAVVQAENDLNISKAQLLTIMGLDPGQSSEYLETGIPTAVTPDEMQKFRTKIGSYGSAVSMSLQKRLDYSAADLRLQAAQASVTGSKSGYYPSVSASGGWNWSNYEIGSFSDNGRSGLNLNLSYPIFDQFRTNNILQSAQVQFTALDIAKKQLEQQIASDVQTAFYQLSAAEKQIEITIRSLKSAEQNFQSASERYKVGTASVLDYTTADAQLVTAKINRINSIFNYVSAQYQLQYAMGTLD